jgi:hypothetical protein
MYIHRSGSMGNGYQQPQIYPVFANPWQSLIITTKPYDHCKAYKHYCICIVLMSTFPNEHWYMLMFDFASTTTHTLFFINHHQPPHPPTTSPPSSTTNNDHSTQQHNNNNNTATTCSLCRKFPFQCTRQRLQGIDRNPAGILSIPQEFMDSGQTQWGSGK